MSFTAAPSNFRYRQWRPIWGWQPARCMERIPAPHILLPVPCCLLLQDFLDSTPAQVEQVVRTNLVGVMLCTRAALRLMQQQPNGGHVFNMDGAGANGRATPRYAAYGATKAGMAWGRQTGTDGGGEGGGRVQGCRGRADGSARGA